MSPARSPIVIRADRPEDGPALRRLAALDSSSVPGGSLLLAEEGEELRAAVGVGSGAVIADPFARTEDLIVLLHIRAEQVRALEGPAAGVHRGRRLRLPRIGPLARRPPRLTTDP